MDDEDMVPIPRTRMGNSCDFCKKRKSKGDSSNNKKDGDPCTNCKMNHQKCTHEQAQKPRGKAHLDKRVKELEHALREERKKVQALTQAVENNSNISVMANPVSSSSNSSPGSSREQGNATNPEQRNAGNGTDDAQLDDFEAMVNDFEGFSLNKQGRYFGCSSNVAYICKLVQMTPQTPVMDPLSHYWSMHHWESGTVLKPHDLTFPPDDLLDSLVDIYFQHAIMVPILPFIHEADFRRDLKTGLQYVDNSFGFVVLGVCAIASRHSDDPRVFLDSEVAEARAKGSAPNLSADSSILPGVGPGLSRHSAGWKFFSQIMALPRALFSAPTLHDVQFCCLFTYYAMGTSAPQANWSMIGLGVRYALELGMHRRGLGGKDPTIEDEIKKRTFWALIFLDRYMALYFGRPCAIRDEDIDLDLPIDCDDEFLEAHFSGGTTPTPTKMAAFLHTVRLVPLYSYAINTVYASRKSKRASNLNDEERIAVIDSMLNAWFGAIPAHLRWDEKTLDNAEWALPTSALYILYYDLQIHVHRPYLQILGSPQTLPSRAICMNAARSVGRLLEAMKRKERQPCFIADMVAFASGIVLVTNIRLRRSAGMSISSTDRDLVDIWRILWVLHESLVELVWLSMLLRKKKIVDGLCTSFNICGRMIHTLKYLANLPREALHLDLMQATNEKSPPFHIPPSGYVPASSGNGITERLDISVLDPTFSGLAPSIFGLHSSRNAPPRHLLWAHPASGGNSEPSTQPVASTHTDLPNRFDQAPNRTVDLEMLANGPAANEAESWWNPQLVDADLSLFSESDWTHNAMDVLPAVDSGSGQWADTTERIFADSLAEFGMSFNG
ncbi:hypothetical protein CYLTODRAFT_441292 [Cylindrobasidium torrendii FP15055 ss-10]|uniref:Xylanolytic transcriptional activator regulatory domain-containing protein n=1 Tax=Cylindrobasidium torrendii FP15055 ss-10 TaxID=1314674 RepID=A0A0D7BM97_9AGAR|nr:hypothetical protein CYLTODRAFT_441292 [Cylindrobasidium torrendii FP15055 ss-10]